MTGPSPTPSLADVAATFDGSRLTLARHLAGLRKSDLAARLEKSATAVGAWESGSKRPTASTVGQLAMTLTVEPSFFSARRQDVAQLSGPPHFRSLRSTSQRVRDQAAAFGHLAVDVASTLEVHVEFPDVDLPEVQRKASVQDRYPELAAQTLRRHWGIGPGPMGHVVRAAENHGVLVVFSRPETASVDAYSFSSRLRPAIVLNPMKFDYYRQRFDVAHELGHLIMHADAEPGGRVVEDEAQRFAAEFLMPAAEIRDLLPAAMGGASWQKLAKLKEQWGVSMQALLYRARSLGRLSDVSYRNAMTTVSVRGWRRHEPGLIDTLEQPSLLPRSLELLQQAGVDADSIMNQCRVPPLLFKTITARAPQVSQQQTLYDAGEDAPANAVISLLR